MYTTPKKRKTYTIIAVLVLILIPVSVLGVLFYEDIRSLAVPGERPQDVRISDITETSAVISWITPDRAVEGWIRYSNSPGVTDGSQLIQDDRDVLSGRTEKRTTHYITLSNLQPATTYYFVIGSGTSSFKDAQRNEFTVTTASITSTSIPMPDPVYGSVSNGKNKSAILYVTLSQDGILSAPVSTYTNDDGNFQVDLAHIRTANLSEPFAYSDSTEMIVFAQGGDKGGAVLRISVGNRDSISLSMDSTYTETDVFSPESILVTEEDSSSPRTDSNLRYSDRPSNDDSRSSDSETDTDTTHDDDVAYEGEYPTGSPRKRHDVPLTRLILGISSSSATQETGIRDILVTNVTENSFTVIWSSPDPELGSVRFGTSPETLVGTARDSRDTFVSQSPYRMHHVSVSSLVPETTYYYEIHSGSQVYNDRGSPYQITVPQTQDSPPDFFSIFGTASGTGASDAVIYARVFNNGAFSSYVSTAVMSVANWTLSLGGIRNQEYTAYATYASSDTLELTIRTRGNSVTETYTIEDITDTAIAVSVDALPETSSGDEVFERGLYDEIRNAITTLPETALSRITVLGLLAACGCIGVGAALLLKVYAGERSNRWERDVLRELDV